MSEAKYRLTLNKGKLWPWTGEYVWLAEIRVGVPGPPVVRSGLTGREPAPLAWKRTYKTESGARRGLARELAKLQQQRPLPVTGERCLPPGGEK